MTERSGIDLEPHAAAVATAAMRAESGDAGTPIKQPALLKSMLANFDLAYQNLESVELGVTTVDHYFDTLGGISSAVARKKGASVPVYIGDQTRGFSKSALTPQQGSHGSRTKCTKGNLAVVVGGVVHGGRHIEQYVAAQVGFLFKALHKQLIGAGVYLPVYVANTFAAVVKPMLRKLYRKAMVG